MGQERGGTTLLPEEPREGRRSPGGGDPSISSGSSKKHLQAEAKINASAMGCFMCLPCTSGALRRACLEVMSWVSEWGYLSSCEERRKGCLPLMEREAPSPQFK